LGPIPNPQSPIPIDFKNISLCLLLCKHILNILINKNYKY
jgi:hypothetical protein